MTSSQFDKRFYKIWASMKTRCNNINRRWYGARGIGYCNEWECFDGFLIDMYQSYLDFYKSNNFRPTIDRIDNKKGYYKENCQWLSREDNCRKATSGRRLFYPSNRKSRDVKCT